MFYSHAYGRFNYDGRRSNFPMLINSETKNKDEIYRIDHENDICISIDWPKYINRSKSMLSIDH